MIPKPILEYRRYLIIKKESARSSKEAVWAHIFSDTIRDSEWLHNKSFSPGRWAIGYPVLYLLYRILDETHPTQILELGLGQSTKMIGQYAKSDSSVQHTVVEHDPEWIAFFSQNFQLSENTNIVNLPLEKTTYEKISNINSYHGFSSEFQNKKFGLICIDAPFGSEKLSRIDVLRMLPQILAEDFMIILDDYNRIGEQNTIKEIKKVLDSHNIPYVTGVYSGDKDVIVLASTSLKFVTSM